MGSVVTEIWSGGQNKKKVGANFYFFIGAFFIASVNPPFKESTGLNGIFTNWFTLSKLKTGITWGAGVASAQVGRAQSTACSVARLPTKGVSLLSLAFIQPTSLGNGLSLEGRGFGLGVKTSAKEEVSSEHVEALGVLVLAAVR